MDPDGTIKLVGAILRGTPSLPGEEDVPKLTATQERARKAAQARWAGHRQRYGDGASTA